MAHNFHPERTDPRGLQKNQRALEALLDLLTDADGEVLVVLRAGETGGQTVLQGMTVEGGVVVNDLGAAVDFRVEGDAQPALLVVKGSTDRVGIRTADPGVTLDVNRGAGTPNAVFSPGAGVLRAADEGTNTEAIVACASNTAAQAPIIYFVRGGGTLASPTAIPAAARIGQFVARAYDGSGGQNPASFYFVVDGTVAAGSVPAALVFETGVSAGTRATRLRLTSAGNAALFGNGSFGGGVAVLFIANATTVPTSNPTGGGILFCEGGALKFRGSSGTVTTIAPA